MSTYGPPILNPSLENYGTPAAPPGPPTPNTPLSPFTVLRTVWLTAASNGGTGSGQSYDPYQVGTAATFDALFATIPSFTRIYFAPGTYLTNTGLSLKDGQMIEGSGIDSTIIRLATNAFIGSGQNITTIVYFGNTVDGTYHSVRNLTVDQNLANQSGATGASTGNVNAIALQTLNGLIENVKVLGAYANPGEGFSTEIYVQNVGSKTALNPAVGNIKNCQYIGNGSVATGFNNITLFSCLDQTPTASYVNQWMTGSIQDCTLVNQPGAIAFGAGGWYNFNICRNKTQNVGQFLVQDTNKGWNVTVADNTCEDFAGNSGGANQCFALINGNNAGQYKNYKFLRNTSRVKSTATQVHHFQTASPDMTDLLIDGHVADTNGVAVPNAFCLFYIQTVDGMIRNCRVSPTYTISSGTNPGIMTCKYENNTCFDGTPIQDVTAGYAQRGAPFLFIKSALGVDLKTVANTTIFTVPAGQRFVLTRAYIAPTVVTALSVQANLIFFGGAIAMANLLTGTAVTALQSMAATPTNPQTIATAGQLVVLQVNGGATATTFTANVYVEGFYL